jgi:hypothetical protein
MSLSDAIETEGHKKILGIPEDIAMVLAIDAVLIFLRLTNILNTKQFVGGKIAGTSILIGAHIL